MPRRRIRLFAGALALVACASCRSSVPGPRAAPLPSVPSAHSSAPPAPHAVHARWAWPLPQGNSLEAAWSSREGDLFGVGEGGTVAHFDAKNARWDVRELTASALTAVWGDDRGTVYAGGQRGALFVTRDDGATWEPVLLATDACIRALFGCGNELYAAGSDGRFAHSKDAGRTFTVSAIAGAPAKTRGDPYPLDGSPDLTGVHCTEQGDVTLMVEAGAFVTSRDHGETWKRRDIGPWELRTLRHDIDREGLGFVKLVPTASGFLILSRPGVPARGQALPTDRWSNVLELVGTSVRPWHAAIHEPFVADKSFSNRPSRAHAFRLLPSGKAVLLTETGNYWTEPSDPEWHLAVRDSAPHPVSMQEPSFWDVAGNEQALYAVGAWGQLFVSRDVGHSWQRQSSVVDNISGLWAEGRHAMAHGQGVAASEDGGKTWETPHRLLSSSSGVNAIWGTGDERYFSHPPGIEYSADGGRSLAPELLPDVEDTLFATAIWGSDAKNVLIAGPVQTVHGGSLLSVGVWRGNHGSFARALTLTTARPSDGITALHGNRDGYVYVGCFEALHRSRDRGATWEDLPALPSGHAVASVHAGKGERVWLLDAPNNNSYAQVVLASRDAGMTFEVVAPPRPNGYVTAIGGSPEGELVVAEAGHVFEQDPLTAAWTELSVGAHAASTRLLSIAASGRGHVLAAGSMGTLLYIGE
jgi:photosystem II stability/assembly factor-like uncharacterized protein